MGVDAAARPRHAGRRAPGRPHRAPPALLLTPCHADGSGLFAHVDDNYLAERKHVQVVLMWASEGDTGPVSICSNTPALLIDPVLHAAQRAEKAEAAKAGLAAELAGAQAQTAALQARLEQQTSDLAQQLQAKEVALAAVNEQVGSVRFA